MSEQTCRASAHRYIGAGLDRHLVQGPCALAHGHEEDHLPIQIAQQQMTDREFNAGVEAAVAALHATTMDRLSMVDDGVRITEALEAGRDQVLREVRRG